MAARRHGLSTAAQVLVVMGVSGSGKTTVATLLARRLGWDFAEGDALHPAANVAKMAAGQPLTDADRAPWLQAVAAWITEHLAAGRSGVITCSALKRRYRDELRAGGVVFVYLAGTHERIEAQLRARSGHFMPSSLLNSQFADLEPPEPDEQAVEIPIAADPAATVTAVIAALAG